MTLLCHDWVTLLCHDDGQHVWVLQGEAPLEWLAVLQPDVRERGGGSTDSAEV